MDHSTPGPPLFSRVCPNSCTLCGCHYLTISSSAVSFSFCLQSFLTSGSSPMSLLFSSGGQSIGASQNKELFSGKYLSYLCDCWLLAAIASLTLNEKVLARVIPPNQDFGPDYAGIFHFQFWQYNEWLDVVIDDRLPTFKDRLVFLHSADLNEFWSALLEKAYAKLNGSYEALKGGSSIEAMEDFTGGVGETFEVKTAPKNFYELLQRALKRSSLVGCSIDITNAAESEARTTTGLIKGHAYSVTGIDEVNYRGQTVRLIRVRNPWGQVEWNGAWSDNSSEWDSLSPSEKQQLHHTALDDGEFWMKFEDFLSNFEKVEICNLTPDALEDNAAHKWEVSIHQGSWVRGATAGGCRNFIETFWTNPQFKLQLTEKDEGQDECTFVAALMQKNRRKLRKLGAALLSIGYAIYESPDKDEHLTKDFFRYHASRAKSKSYINLREVSDRFELPPGDYIIVPTTYEPQQEADFCLRVFSEKKFAYSYILIKSNSDQLARTSKNYFCRQRAILVYLFKNLGKKSGCTFFKLAHFIKMLKFCFCSQFMTSKENLLASIIHLIYSNYAYYLLSMFLSLIQSLYLHFDADQSGTMSSHELRLALKAAGFQLNNYLLQLIVLRYSDDQQQIEFDDFLNCLIRLENASSEYLFIVPFVSLLNAFLSAVICEAPCVMYAEFELIGCSCKVFKMIG
uniref:Calpain 9 n=1 Tax=Naja naja TaxID=35670 RepID=A0A8C7DV42_NAJNA